MSEQQGAPGTGTTRVKRGMAEMLKGGVIMDVVTADQAKIAEDAGAVAVMALERVPADIRAQLLAKAQALARAQESLKGVGLVGFDSRLPSELSGGQQQRVAVARALAARPAVIFGDEPTGNLDSKAGTEVLEFMRRSVDELGQSIVMVTHDARAASYADSVLFLTDGRIVGELAEPTIDAVLDKMKSLS